MAQAALADLLHEAFPIFQVEATNIRGAYENWRRLVAFEDEGGRISVLPDDEKDEADKIYEKSRAENLETWPKLLFKGLLNNIEREKK